MFDIAKIRHQFPALHGGAVFLDNPGGTQAVKNCLDRMLEYLIDTNANHEGAFKTSRESDAMIHKARAAMADFLNAARPEEIVFGQNMTSLTFQLSRSLARRFRPGRRDRRHPARPRRQRRALAARGRGAGLRRPLGGFPPRGRDARPRQPESGPRRKAQARGRGLRLERARARSIPWPRS